MESTGFPNLPADEKQKITDGHGHAMKECERLKAAMNASVEKLLELDEFWPILGNENEEHKELLRMLTAEVAELKKSAPIKGETDDSVVGGKRKRSAADEGGVSSNRMDREMEKMEGDVTTLTARLAEQENDVNGVLEDITTAVTERIDEKMLELQESWTKTTGHSRKKLREVVKRSAELKERVDEVGAESEKTSAIVPELGREIEEVKATAETQRQEAAARLEEILLYTAKYDAVNSFTYSGYKQHSLITRPLVVGNNAAQCRKDGQGIA